jgi:hypothetical protein
MWQEVCWDRWFVVVIALLMSRAAAAQCCVNTDVCPGLTSPCTVTTACDVGRGTCLFDLTGIDVTFSASGGLNADGNDGALLVNDLNMAPGSRFCDGLNSGVSITIDLTGNYVQNGTADLRSANGGGDDAVSADGMVEVNDNSWVQGAGSAYGSAGTVTLTAGDSLWIDGPIDATGPNNGDGGVITLWSGTTVMVLENLLASGGWWGGAITIDAVNDVGLDGDADFQGTSNGDGGAISVSSSTGSVWTPGKMDADGYGDWLDSDDHRHD